MKGRAWRQHIQLSGEHFAVARDTKNIAAPTSRLRAIGCKVIGSEATGG